MSRPKSEYKYNDLEFVNVTAPREHKNFAHQKAIKKHNMLRYWRGRNKGSCDSCRNRHLQPAQEATNCSREDENVHDDEDECSSLTIGDPHDRLGSGARNPFANYSIPATPYVDELLQYWLTHHLCDTFCTIEGAMKADNPAMDAFLLVVIRDPAMFHALLTVSSSLMDSSYGRKTPSTRTLEHMGSAITLVNESLNDSQQATRDRVLLTICLMTASHCIFKDYSNHELHVNGMHQIILLRGGIENIRASLLIYRIILWADQFRGLYTGTAPRYRVASSLSESPSTPPKPASKNTSLTLVDPEPWSVRGVLSNRFILMMEQITDLEKLIESCRGTRVSSATIQDFYSQRESIEECFIDSIAETHVNSSGGGAYEQCCLLAASLHFYVIIRPFPIWSGVQSILLMKLKDALMKTDSISCWGDDIELFLWVLMEAAAVEDSLKPWFTQLLTHTLRTFVPKPSLKRIKDILRKFLWNERTSSPACEKVYKDIQDTLS